MANNSQGSKKPIGKIKAKVEIKPKTQAEFEEAQISTIKGEPLEVSRIMPKSKTGEQEPEEALESKGQKGQPPVEEFNPMDNESSPAGGKSPQAEESTKSPQENEEENPEEEVEENAEEEEQAEEQEQKEKEAEQEKEGEENPQDTQKDQAKNEVKQKLAARAKKAAGQWLKKNISKAGAKAAVSAIWGFIVAFWPYILGALVIFFIILMIAGSCSRQTGKTPTQPLNKTTDKKLVLQALAAGQDKAAQRELIADEAIAVKDKVKKLSTDNADTQKIITQINQLLDEIVALSDSEGAVSEKVKQLLLLLDELKKLLPDQVALIDEIKNQIIGIQKMVAFYQRGHLIFNPKDMDYIRNYEADRRLIQMLVYLVTPTDQGGAGHERLRVKRIRFSYDTERKSVSKETDYSEKDEPNVSAHFTGQAADITEVDCIKCTQIKRRRVGSNKKTKLDPTHIKVAWQSEEGYLKAGGPDAFGQNMHQVFKNLGRGAIGDILAEQISDIIGIEIDPEKLKGMTFQEMTRYVGNAIVKETLGIPGDYETGNSLEDIAGAAGRAYLAKALDVPFESIRGGSPDELMENIGRAILEEKMSLPAGSLAGTTSDEIFASVGRRLMENSLGLSRNTLSTPYQDGETFFRLLGQGKIEASLGLKPQTFYGESIEEVKKRVGPEAIKATFANSEAIDNWLGISTGSTEKLINSQISPNGYNRLVGSEIFEKELGVYEKIEKRAEALGITESDMLKFITTSDVFVSIGQTTISKTLTVSDEEQTLLRQWFYAKQKSDTLDEDYLAGQYGLKEGDLGKIFVDDLAKEVFQRVGQVETLNRLSANPKLSSYLQPVVDFQFYNDRLHLIKDNLEYLEQKSPSQEVRDKATETKNLVNGLLEGNSISDIRKNTKQIQVNVKFIEENESDAKAKEKIKEIKKAINEIIEGKEIQDFDTVSPDTMTAKTDPQVKLTKKDIYGLLTGKKKVDDLVYAIGLRKWEIELDLPDESLANAFQAIKQDPLQPHPDETILISIGRAKIKERGGTGGDSSQVDKDLGLPQGTTADYRAGKITENAYYRKVGATYTDKGAASLLNRQFKLTKDPYYALTGEDIAKALSGGWFWVALKASGKAIDEALDFPAGGTLDILEQTEKGGDVISALAEVKLGHLAGLDHPVSINGELSYNLGRAKIESYFDLKPNELNDGNLKEKIKNYTNSDVDKLSRLDMAFGLSPMTSQSLVESQSFMTPHEYISKVGTFLQDGVIYDKLTKNTDNKNLLRNRDFRNAVISLASQTGSPQEILGAAGAKQLGKVLGLDYPISIRGNFKDNLGEAKVEDRLGLLHGSFADNIDIAISLNGTNFANGQEKFESAFYIKKGQLFEARNANSGYWTDDNKNRAKIVDAILNIPAGTTEQFITGAISLPDYVDKVGQSSMLEVSADKLVDLLDLDDKYKPAVNALVKVINTDPKVSSPESQRQLYRTLMQTGGWNLDNKLKFDPGTVENMLIVNPEDPEHTGLKNADYVILEQGKKWLPRWLGFSEEQDDKYGNWVDIIYEQGLKEWGPAGLYNEQIMTMALMSQSGIPDENDAKKLLRGDFRGAITAWGAAQLVEMYNKEFSADPNNPSYLSSYTTYYEVKKAYFNDLEGEKAIGDAAVTEAREEAGGVQLDSKAEKTIRQEAIRESRDVARKDIQHRVIDIRLHHADESIPAGFTKAMREGTSEEKWTMGLTYVGNKYHQKNPDIPAEIIPDLAKYFDPGSPTFHDPKAMSDSTYAVLDTKMNDWFGGWIQPGTAKALALYGQTEHLGQPNEEGTLMNVYANYGINIVANWADKKTNLPAGTTKLAYDYFTKYQAAVKVYREAQTALAAARLAGNPIKISEASQAAQKSEAALNSLKADAITMVVTFAFQKQLAQMDQSLGLVPGSSAMLVGMGVELWITGAVSPWTIGLFVVTNLFGVYRIDVTCTACGYYPALETAPAGQTCPLGEFDGTSQDAFKTNSIAAAQHKVNQLINDVLEMPQKLNDDNLTPTQIMTYRQEDVDGFSGTLNDLYGPAATRMNSGLWANELMWDHVHIGY